MTTNELKEQVYSELTTNILPFWIGKMTDPEGGFFGRMDGLGRIDKDSPRGLILNARILWTFSAAYRVLGKEEYLASARWAKEEILRKFRDSEYGGAYWCLDADSAPADTKKQFYAIAFAIYGLAEYYRVTSDPEALGCAKDFFRCIEEHSRDKVLGGYIEACTREWGPIEDMRLSDKDRNDAKTMNTHLHILEGYTNLYRIWKSEELGEALRSLTELFLDRIAGLDGHLQLFFDEDWTLKSTMQSFGHDIEASWLIREAALVLGDPGLISRATEVCHKIAEAGLEGFSISGGMVYEWDPRTGKRDGDRHWWVQAETVVGCFDQWQTTSDERYLEYSKAAWRFIRNFLICPDGEWYWSIREDGSANTDDDRAGFWKCPYHNSRMCLELIERIK